jgi:4-aminobutyrate aminotransferase
MEQTKLNLPGKVSAGWLERADKRVARAYSVYLPAMITRAQGSTLYDIDGNAYIDFVGGVGCLNVGHSHPKVVEALTESVRQFTHTDYTMFPYTQLIELAERLTAYTNIPDAKAVFFNSGAEAVENAIKIARAYTKRPGVIAFDGAFHGRTFMAMSLTSKLHPYKEQFGPYANNVYRLPYPNDSHGPSLSEFKAWLDRASLTWFEPEHIAAMIVEPIQGEGGYIVPTAGFFGVLREYCDKHGIVLIADEIQSGYGRTGKFFAIEHEGILPDLMTAGKSIAAGIPLSAVLGKPEIMDAPRENAIGGTYVGNPVACSAALAVLDVMEAENLVERATLVGNRIRTKLEELAQASPYIGDVRGRGAMMAIEFVKDKTTMEPYPEAVSKICQAAMREGLVLMKCGIYGNAIRFLCPLNIEWSELDKGLDIFGDVVMGI